MGKAKANNTHPTHPKSGSDLRQLYCSEEGESQETGDEGKKND